MARVLADAGAKPEVIDWMQMHFECAACKATMKPGLPRPAAARTSYHINKTVGADHSTHTFASHQFDFLNVLCWGTGKIMVSHTESKKARDTQNNLMNTWVKPFGFMELFVVDQGIAKELQGGTTKKFQQVQMFRKRYWLVPGALNLCNGL